MIEYALHKVIQIIDTQQMVTLVQRTFMSKQRYACDVAACVAWL